MIMGARSLSFAALLFAIMTFILWGMTNFMIKYGTVHGLEKPQLVALMWVMVGAVGLTSSHSQSSWGSFEVVL